MSRLPRNYLRFFAWALFLLLLSIWIATEINADMSGRWQTEAEYNEALKARSGGR